MVQARRSPQAKVRVRQMTASEVLRALDQAMQHSYNRTLSRDPLSAPGIYSSREISTLRNALPLIADCIQRLEETVPKDANVQHPSRRVLDALTEALDGN